MNKKGLSQVLGTVLLIAMTIALIAVIWGVINTFVEEKLDKAGDCKDVFNKVSFNNDYTCYNSSANITVISLNVGEIEVDSLLLAITYGESSKSYRLTNESKTIEDMLIYRDGSKYITMPAKESGKTYIINRTGRPTKVEIAPKVGGTQCEVSDFINSIATCI